MKLSSLKNITSRRKFLRDILNIKLDAIASSLADKEDNIHCENLIGGVSIPIGVAGPLVLKGEYVNGEFYIPLATTEGALVASVNRGSKAVSFSGGANVYAYNVGVTRGPVFYVGTLSNHRKLIGWLKTHEVKIKEISEKTSSHLLFKKMMIKGLADYIFVRLYFDTEDAMGMNMATIATQKIVEYIEKQTGIACLSIAGNFDIDKKPAWLNFIDNRGFKTWGEVIISRKIVREVLKTDPEKIFELWLGKCMLGSAMSGSLGYNAHFANIVAAFFAATGQDIAHVVEGSMGITTTKVLTNGDLYISIYMPAVMIGTVGGGTNLKSQTEARGIVGVKKSIELAEILTGAVLAGELSLLASLTEGTLAQVHKKLGR